MKKLKGTIYFGPKQDKKNKIKESKDIVFYTYEWWKNDKSDINPAHIKSLQKITGESISKIRMKGLQSGKLVDDEYDGFFAVRPVIKKCKK